MQTSHMLVSSSSREGRNSKHEGERRPASNFLFGKEAFITSNLAPFLATSSRSPAPKDGPGQLFLGPPDSYGQCVHTGILPSIIIFCQFLLFFTNFWPKHKAIFSPLNASADSCSFLFSFYLSFFYLPFLYLA